MIKFRRTIAIFMLALFACQTVMAGVGEHPGSASASTVNQSVAQSDADHPALDGIGHDHSAVDNLADSNCCHAHGHCHLLAFAGQFSAGAIAHGQNLFAALAASYHSPSLDTLLRPPANA